MNCRYCGAALPNNAKFCTSCGAAVVAEDVQYAAQETYQQYNTQDTYQQYAAQDTYQQSNTQVAYQPYVAPAAQRAADDGASTILTLGILGLVFSFLFSLAGLILSAIGMSKAKKFRLENGSLYGKAQTGNGLSIAGLIISILSIVIALILIIVGVAATASYGYYY